MRLSLKLKFIILALILGLFVVSNVYLTTDSVKGIFEASGGKEVKNTLLSIQADIKGEINDYKKTVLTLSSISDTKHVVEEMGMSGGGQSEAYKKYLQRLEDTFYTYVSENENFFQLRYIDKNGMEIVRVSRKDKKSVVEILRGSELSNKADRYYFTSSVGLEQGEVYVSELDLNVENNQIQIPYVPTIRFATPVFGNEGENKGVIVLNVFADKIIETIYSSPYPKTYLLDQDGYYLYNPEAPEKEWGRYLGHPENKFYHFSGDEADYIKGALRSDPFFSSKNSLDAEDDHRHFFYKADYTSVTANGYWVVATSIDDSTFFAPYYSLRSKIILQNIFVVLIAILVFIFFMNRFTKPLKYLNRAVKSLNIGNYNISIPVISRDELGELSEKINSLVKTIRERDREKYDFISSASHQLKTPVSIVRMNLDILEDEIKKNKAMQKYIRVFNDISEGNKKVISILGDFLRYIEIGDNYFATNLTNINLRDMVSKIVTSFSKSIKKQGVTVKIDIPENLIIRAEESRFKLAIMNLIENAIEYSNENGIVKIKARGKNELDDNHYAYFEVKDNGIGIPDSEQIYIFDHFFRAKNAYTKKSTSSGLGLLITKKVVEGHGGKIGFKSEENKGTTFYFTIYNP